MNVAKVRRHDLDWLRVSVFGVLIIYHVGMYFVPWGWHIKYPDTFDSLVWPMTFINQWRLPILFMISGMGTRFALSYRSGQLFRRERLVRLGLPLIAGIVLVVPPQIYIERILHGEYSGSFIHFYLQECFRGIYPNGNLSWHHLWFLPYLLIFSIILSPVFIYLRDNADSLIISLTKNCLSNKFGIYVFIIPLILIEVFIEPIFPVSHALVGDWYVISFYIFLFFFGYLFMACQKEFWNAVNEIKRHALILALIAFSLYYVMTSYLEDGLLIYVLKAIIKTINFWSWIIVLFGFASSFLNRPSKVLAYCNEAVYPFYILHQTVQILLCYVLLQFQIGAFVTLTILIIGTFLISWLLYEFLIRRIRIIRPLFGLKN